LGIIIGSENAVAARIACQFRVKAAAWRLWAAEGGEFMAMVKTSIEIDQDALAMAAEVLGPRLTKTR
jgi:hypothetical protein